VKLTSVQIAVTNVGLRLLLNHLLNAKNAVIFIVKNV
jgi:hypothetical protein